MPTLAITHFNIVCAILGGFTLLFGLVSYFAKERLYLSEALISFPVGVAFGPHAANFVQPLVYANNSEVDLDSITLAFSRLVLGVQLVLAGVQLPSKYLFKEWKSLALLLGPIMTCMWIMSSLLIWALVPHLPYLHALAIAACITPTDPILSNTIVKGKFADKHIPVDLQRIIIAESGANDGLGYPFLFIALYFIKYCEVGQPGFSGGAGHAIGLWFSETMCYTILLSVAYGAVVGWIAKDLLHWAEGNKLVDRESFLVFAIALALFIIGTCGMIGSDDVLACFIAGNVFTIDDWFRLETLDDSLQPTIDMLLNITIFIWYGAVIPWNTLTNTPELSIGRLLGLAALIILLRRLPVVWALHKIVPRINNPKEALFMGYFGPIGVSAIFYLYITLEFLEEMETHHLEGSDENHVQTMIAVIRPIVWINVLASVIVHGITVPFIKLGNAIPQALFLSRNTSTAREPGTSGLDLPGLGAIIGNLTGNRETNENSENSSQHSPEDSNSKSESDDTPSGEKATKDKSTDLEGHKDSSGTATPDEKIPNRLSKDVPLGPRGLATTPSMPTSEISSRTSVDGEAWKRNRQITIVDPTVKASE